MILIHSLLILCSQSLFALSIDISLTDARRVRAEDVRARHRWFAEQGLEVRSIEVPNAPGAHLEVARVAKALVADAPQIESLILNVDEPDRRQRYSLGALGVLKEKDGPDAAVKVALAPLVGRFAPTAHVVIISPSLRRGNFDDLKSRAEGLMKYLEVTEGSFTIVEKTPRAVKPRNRHAAPFVAIASLAGLVPLAVLSQWFPLPSLATYAVVAAGLVAADRWVIKEGLRDALSKAIARSWSKPAWRMRLRGGEVYWAESVHLLQGFQSIRSCAEGLVGRVRGPARP